MLDEDDIKGIENMAKYGGSFASALSKAWLNADEVNQVKLKKEFSSLLEKYKKFNDVK